MENNNFEQKLKPEIDTQADNQKEAPEKDSEILHYERELKEREEEEKKYEELEKLHDEYEKLMSEHDEKWDSMVAADNEEWAMIEKMFNEIDELSRKTEDQAEKDEIEDEIWNKYETLIDDLREKNKIAWQSWKEINEKLEEKNGELKAIRNQLFKKETK